MDLGEFDDPAAEAALVAVASDTAADEDLIDTCGEALASIWLRRGAVDEKIKMKLLPVSARICVGTLRVGSEELANRA